MVLFNPFYPVNGRVVDSQSNGQKVKVYVDESGFYRNSLGLHCANESGSLQVHKGLMGEVLPELILNIICQRYSLP
jgi:hypothetical protein